MEAGCGSGRNRTLLLSFSSEGDQGHIFLQTGIQGIQCQGLTGGIETLGQQTQMIVAHGQEVIGQASPGTALADISTGALRNGLSALRSPDGAGPVLLVVEELSELDKGLPQMRSFSRSSKQPLPGDILPPFGTPGPSQIAHGGAPFVRPGGGGKFQMAFQSGNALIPLLVK